MKKNGFTLAEILITLSIIGIAAAIAAPSITRAIPDKYKPKVLKTYQTISNITSDLLANDNLYFKKDIDPTNPPADSDYNTNGTFKTTSAYGCKGLNCTEKPRSGSGYNTDDYKGICKYPNLVAAALSVGTPTKCTDSSKFSNFKTSDGTTMKIEAAGTTVAGGYLVEIDIDQSTNGKDCVYNKTSCKNPDKYRFHVDSDGNITADSTDHLTEVYLEHMTRVDKKADFDAAYQK